MNGPDKAITEALCKLNDLADASGIKKSILIVEIAQLLTDVQKVLIATQSKEINQNGID